MTDKCSLLAGGTYVDRCCKPLSEVSTGQHGRAGKGILSADMVELDTGKRLGTRYAIASGKHVKPPALLYFCPFCAQPLVRTD